MTFYCTWNGECVEFLRSPFLLTRSANNEVKPKTVN